MSGMEPGKVLVPGTGPGVMGGLARPNGSGSPRVASPGGKARRAFPGRKALGGAALEGYQVETSKSFPSDGGKG